MRLISSLSPDHRSDTRDRILDTAERLFAEHGYELTSLRAITAEAGVNLAAVNYHFGSKERLLEAVLERLVGPVNAERLTRLDDLESRGTPPVEALIEAFVGPAMRLSRTPGRAAVAHVLLGRCQGSPDERMRALLLRLFGPVLDRFIPAFGRALPDLPHEEILWRMFFMIGVMTQTMTCGHHLKFVSGGRCDPGDLDEAIARMVAFVAAAMRSPSLGPKVHP